MFLNFSFAFSPDGRRLAVALANVGAADVSGPWPSASWCSTPAPGARCGGGAIRFRRGQMGAHVLFGRDGALITSAPQGATLMWDARSGRIVRRYATAGAPRSRPTGERSRWPSTAAFVGDPSAALGLLDLRTGRLRRLEGKLPDEWIMSLAFTRDGKRIVGPSFGGHARVGRRQRRDRRHLPEGRVLGGRTATS